MADQVPTSNVSGGFILSNDDFAIIAEGIIVSSGGTTIVATSNNHIDNSGSIIGAIGLTLGLGSFLYNRIGGDISAETIGVNANATNVVVDNAGTIFGGGVGVLHNSGSSFALYNSGTIISGHESGAGHNAAILLLGGTSDTIINSGVIKVLEPGSSAILDAFGASQNVTNTGTIIGDVALGGGEDVFNGVTGTVSGVIDGGPGADLIQGSALADRIYGGSENDVLRGNAGDDFLDGLDGADTMIGGSGHDVYFVDDAGDFINEFGGTGIDVVASTISFSLADTTHVIGAVENLSLGGSAANATGNALANVIIGNTAANTLTGAAGNDRVNGSSGNDHLSGGLGRDTLTGATGSDFFVFNTAPNTSSNRDIITDFDHVADTIQLENSVFTKLGAPGVLKAAFLRLGPAALDADDHVIYNHATGLLSYDSNGNAAGGVQQIAFLQNKPVLALGDFVVI